jgi:hypothetical protein
VEITITHHKRDATKGDSTIEITISTRPHSPSPEREYLTADEVCAEYNLPSSILECQAREGNIHYMEVDGKRCFSRYAIEKWLNNGI